MSEEYESNTVDTDNVYYSPFWPLTIVLAGLIIWLGYQVFVLNEQRNAMSSQLDQMTPTLQQAQMAQNRLVALLKDLAQTGQKDPNANQILKEAIQAGLLRVNPAASANAGATDTASAPAPAASSTDSSTNSAP